MHKRLVVAALVSVVVTFLGGGVAGAEATQSKVHNQDVTATIPFFNVCTGTTDNVTITFSGLDHFVTRPTGTGMVNSNSHGTFVLTDGTTGRYTAQHVESGGANDILSDSLHAKGTASDGTTFELTYTIHSTENGQGVVTASFLKGCA
jgi:hypothetical protein